MIREKKVRINQEDREYTGTLSYFSPYLMKKRREAELPGHNHELLLELKSFDIASLLVVKGDVMAEGRGYDHYDSFQCLQGQMSEQSAVIQACGNCQFFLFSGMARDMSNGSRGYCLHGRLGQNLRPRDIREIFHVCEHFEFGPKDEREAFRQRWKTSLMARPMSERPRPNQMSDLPEDPDRPATS